MSMKRVKTKEGLFVNRRTAIMIKCAERRAGFEFWMVQGSYNTSVSASGGTHAGGGAGDFSVNGLSNKQIAAAVLALREVGFAAWHREELWQNGTRIWGPHIHVGALEDPEASDALKRQFVEYRNGDDGLAGSGRDTGPRLSPIPVWPISIKDISVARATHAFQAKKKRKTISVARIQRLLNRRMGLDIVVDGVAGPQTQEAYKKWEKRVKAPTADGIPGGMSLRALVAGFFRVVK